MGSKNSRRGVSRAEWLDAGLDSLARGGVEAVKVERLARSLRIAKSGFYWHFRDREDLLQQMLDHWAHELTEVVSENEMIRSLPPARRLLEIAEMIVEYDLNRLDAAIRQWASEDKVAARAVRRVNRARLGFVGAAFAELGFEGDDLEMRTMLFVGYQSSEDFIFPDVSRKRRRELIERRIKLLTRK